MGEELPSNKPESWATTDEIPDVNMVREKLAVTKEVKENIEYVQ